MSACYGTRVPAVATDVCLVYAHSLVAAKVDMEGTRPFVYTIRYPELPFSYGDNYFSDNTLQGMRLLKVVVVCLLQSLREEDD